jgi:ribonuclease P protein component
MRGACFDLHYCGSVAKNMPRLGWIVPKRLARAASLRNAIKRQGREAFRLVAGEIPPYDLVLRLKQPVVGVRASDGEQRRIWRMEIEALLGRLRSLRA